MTDYRPIFDLNEKDPQLLIRNYQTLPCTANSGARVSYISDDLTRVTVHIPFNEQTKNMMGITYGGVMYSATDAVYVTMLWYHLGYDYFLVDKSSTVKYMRPGTSDLTAEFHLELSEIKLIKQTLENKRSISREYLINIVDEQQKTICKITKEIVIRKVKQII